MRVSKKAEIPAQYALEILSENLLNLPIKKSH